MNITKEKVVGLNDVYLYTLTTKKLTVKLTNLGATVVSVIYPDGTDVVLGYDDISMYQDNPNYFGATIGRCANRIANGQFELDGKTYHINRGNQKHALHGGEEGFNKKIFRVKEIENGLTMSYVSLDLEEGFPGNLSLDVTFRLIEDRLEIHYDACSDKDTLINLTNHMYFALQGAGNGEIENLEVQTPVSKVMENDADHLATGNIFRVDNRAHDFRTSRKVVQALKQTDDVQIATCEGFDNFFIFDEDESKKVVLVDEKTKNKLVVTTDLPGFHMYVPNYEPPVLGKGNKAYQGNCAICIETSFAPDAIHNQAQPDVVYKANEPFRSTTVYTFTKVYG
ncbi:hypothetical protein A4S06_09925 [Erysipelotrichaceae bacterium MTC7]|nr:hypothetical protein A4S06_09925 [Erysipelotrichaceae bacterium MTC7]